LIEETDRLQGTAHPRVPCDDFALLFSHYLDSDLLTAGMPSADLKRFLSHRRAFGQMETARAVVARRQEHRLRQAVAIAIEELYGWGSCRPTPRAKCSEAMMPREESFYEHVLRKVAKIESCQVNCLTGELSRNPACPRS